MFKENISSIQLNISCKLSHLFYKCAKCYEYNSCFVDFIIQTIEMETINEI
jgi:hypothetical protein